MPWQDYWWLPDVVMIGLDPAVSTVDLANALGMQVARGSPMTDASGSRQATLLFNPGTTAQMVMPDGGTQPLSTLHVRATEYTVGTNGPKAMPAELPPNSGYTYAVNLSTDEELAAGATTVRFSQPVIHYVENFLHFPVGSPVPVGHYDRAQGKWLPSDNGRVIKLLSTTGGLADLDVTGSGIASSQTDLAQLGITDAERQRLASLYGAGVTLWRVPIAHFSDPWDFNWPFGPPRDARGPSGGGGGGGGNGPDDPCRKSGGSIIGCETQTLGEALDVVGTPFTLHYQSERTAGHTVDNTLRSR